LKTVNTGNISQFTVYNFKSLSTG